MSDQRKNKPNPTRNDMKTAHKINKEGKVKIKVKVHTHTHTHTRQT